MDEVNLRKLAVDINRAPTMMVMTVRNEVICEPATYYPREGWQRSRIRYYRYEGPLSPGWILVEQKGRSEMENSHGVHRDGVEMGGHSGGNFDQTVRPYLTEYDFMQPEEMPEWMAMLWVKYQEMRLREGKVQSQESMSLMGRIRILRERMGDEKEVLRVAWDDGAGIEDVETY